jgi:hypothetical protein
MKKIAFFVEGQTEQIFINRLVKEMLGYNDVTIIQKKVSGGTNAPKREFVRNFSISRESKYMVLIYDCGSDNRVKSEILENIESLRESGYSYIVGLRDLYPLSIEELPRLEKGMKFLPYEFRKLHDAFDIVIAIREVETWFLAETDHFTKVDKRLTGHFIEKRLGFDPYTINPISRIHPSDDLNNIYKLVGRSYTKKHWQIDKLVQRLNFRHIRHELKDRITSLGELIKTIEQFKREEQK